MAPPYLGETCFLNFSPLSSEGGYSNVNTVTRAVMILGFDAIRAVCQTKAVVESLLQGTPRERLTQKMACAFHAAVQARWLAGQQAIIGLTLITQPGLAIN